MTARMMAGVPASNASLYRRIRFLVGDPVAILELPGEDGVIRSTLILRDIEIERAKLKAQADRFASPKDFSPLNGLSGDREIATAQAAAECLSRHAIESVTVDRTMPMIFVEMIRRRGIEVLCDEDWGILERRRKDEREVAAIAHAQEVTEKVMQRACETIGDSIANAERQLVYRGVPLTSERMRSWIDQWLLEFGFSNPESIVACGRHGGDCHEHGSGPLRTEEAIIIDIFPEDKSTLYHGDCTRTVVHGQISDRLLRMHEAVVESKHAATQAVKPGITGHNVHEVTLAVIQKYGFATRLPDDADPVNFTAMTHGTGHGLGLEVHEAPLLAENGVMLLEGDVVTIEPGRYCRSLGGIRVEDMFVVEATGARNLNQLHEGLGWKST